MDGLASPLFPFGFGLSYTTFQLGQLRVYPIGIHSVPVVARAQVLVKNTGSFAASQVVQCYARDPIVRHVRRSRRLVGFERIDLEPGGSLFVEVGLTAEDMALLDDQEVWRVLPGEYVITCGVSSNDPNALSATLRL